MQHTKFNPFPIWDLPPAMREAISEVTSVVKAPVEIAVASALSVLSLTGQDQVDVRLPIGITVPTSLYLFTIADSGERKTAVDGFFTPPVKNLEETVSAEYEEEFQTFEADLFAWNVKTNVLKKALAEEMREEIESEI